MREQIDFAAVKDRVLLSEVVGRSVKLKRSGREWQGCCPFHADKSPSFYVDDTKSVWNCFGCGKAGDVLEFVKLSEGVSLPQAARLLGAAEWAGPVAKVAKAAKVEPPVNIDEARAVVRSALPIAGTVGERYLRECRGINGAVPASVRFAQLRYGKRAGVHPAVVAAVQAADGRVTGCQRIYLATDGSGKADLKPNKLSLGRILGGAVRLGPIAAELVLVEGLEDGLSLAETLPGASVWVTCGTSFLPAVVLPDACRTVTIAADNDAAGATAADKAVASYTSQGRAVRVMRPPAGFKDWNDLHRGIAQ